MQRPKEKRRRIDVVEKMSDLNMPLPWYRAIAMAIIVRAKQDWDMLNLNGTGRDSIEFTNQRVDRWELENFFQSPWCDLLLTGTSYDTENFREGW